jgi:hypothetical protein
MIRHIPNPVRTATGRLKTYCGLNAERVVCIDVRRDCIEDAECRTCQRSDDRRTREAYRKTDEYRQSRAS